MRREPRTCYSCRVGKLTCESPHALLSHSSVTWCTPLAQTCPGLLPYMIWCGPASESPAPVASDAPKGQSKQAAAKAPKKKQEKKVKREWTEEEKAAARAKAGGGNASKSEAKGKKATKNAAPKEPEPAAVDDVPAVEPAVPSGADTVSNVEGYYYAGYGVWALRPGAVALGSDRQAAR